MAQGRIFPHVLTQVNKHNLYLKTSVHAQNLTFTFLIQFLVYQSVFRFLK